MCGIEFQVRWAVQVRHLLTNQHYTSWLKLGLVADTYAVDHCYEFCVRFLAYALGRELLKKLG